MNQAAFGDVHARPRRLIQSKSKSYIATAISIYHHGGMDMIVGAFIYHELVIKGRGLRTIFWLPAIFFAWGRKNDAI